MLASIIIRARNEATALQHVLPLLQGQRCDFDFEILVLDNDSNDGSQAIVRAAGLALHHIPRDAFNYARALNQGAELAQGEYVVNISAHCYPLSDTWLSALIQPLRENPQLIASYGRQWTDPQVAPFEAMGNDSIFPPAGRAPALVAFSNANAAIRRSQLLAHPFNPVVKILEDHLFYLELLEHWQFVYVPEALVLHAHDSFSMRYYLKRWMREGWAYFFISQHRGYSSPFAKQQHISLREFFIGYPWLASVFARRSKFRTALMTIPFFWLRDSIWALSFALAASKHAQIAQDDQDLRKVQV